MPRHYATDTALGRLMARRGYTKAEVIAASGMSDRTLTEVLAGRSDIPPGKLLSLCKLFHVNPEELC